MKILFSFSITIFLFTLFSCTQSGSKNLNNTSDTKHNQLRKTLLDSISKYKANVGLSVLELETGDTLSINGKTDFAMQSVYKFPLALTVLNKLEKYEITLNQKIFLSKEVLDRYSWSPLKRQNPGDNFYLSVDSVMRYMISYSDNLACDMMFQLVGGTIVADSFIHKIGFPEIHIKYTEAEMGEEFNRMYFNSTTPVEMTSLLKNFYEQKIINQSNTKYLLNYMINDSSSHNRILGNLPKEIKVAHKTGTGIQNDTMLSACNDIGIIYLPNGRHLAIAIFTMNSKENIANTERLIAVLSKEIFDYYK